MAMDIGKKIRVLRSLFAVAFALLMLCVVATPLLLSSRVVPLETVVLDEDLLESILIAVLLVLAGAMFALYRRERRSLQRQLVRASRTNKVLTDRLTDAFRYIGTVNVQLQEIQAVFAEVIRYPENRREFKRMLADIAAKVLCTVNKEWMLIRVIDPSNLKTLIEHWQTRGTAVPAISCISNRSAIGQAALPDVAAVRSRRENAAVIAVCVFPLPPLNREERILMGAVAAELEMMYSLFALRAAAKSQAAATASQRAVSFANAPAATARPERPGGFQRP